MAQFKIREENMDRLNKKMESLSKKFAKTHCSFTYEVTGEEFQTVEDAEGKEYTAKYFTVEADGVS